MFRISITVLASTTPVEQALATVRSRDGIAVVLGPGEAKFVSTGDLARAHREGRRLLSEVEGTPSPALGEAPDAQDPRDDRTEAMLHLDADHRQLQGDKLPNLLVTFYTCNKNFNHCYTPRQYAALPRDKAGNRLCSNLDGGIVS